MFLLIVNPVFAAMRYTIVVDAGSSGSRIYLYQYQKSGVNKISDLQLIASKKVHPGLSNFVDNYAVIDNYIKPLLIFVKDKLNAEVNESQVNFYLLSTAGMRLLSTDQQQQIYQHVKAAVNKYTNFEIKQVETITGQWEALYGWIAANYGERLLVSGKTVGILDMGGASAEVAFEMRPGARSSHAVNLRLGANNFLVYAVSYLGLGQNQIRNQFANNASCFSRGYPLPSGEMAEGDYRSCTKAIKPFLKEVHNVDEVKKMIAPGTKFIAVSWYHDLLHSNVFSSGAGFTPAQLYNKGVQICSQSWNSLKMQYGDNPYLYSACFNLAYYYELLTNGFKFKDGYYFNTLRDVDWALGVVVFQAYNN
jgi:apyrase